MAETAGITQNNQSVRATSPDLAPRSRAPEPRSLDSYGPPPPAAPKHIGSMRSRWTPAQADRHSHTVARATADAGPKLPLKTFIYTLNGPDGEYRVTFSLPSDIYTDEQIQELLRNITSLNRSMGTPIQKFVWDETLSKIFPYGPHYDPLDHSVHLLRVTAPQKLENTLSTIIHEMGHGVYETRFQGNQDWEAIFRRALVKNSYEIIDDSNYYDISDGYGHPFSNAHEAFASAVHAYFNQADEFAQFINNPRTSAAKKTFGKLVWCFMREEVFKGAVFTANQEDPFRTETLSALQKELEPVSMAYLRAALKEPDLMIQKIVIEYLGDIDLNSSEGDEAVTILLKQVQAESGSGLARKTLLNMKKTESQWQRVAQTFREIKEATQSNYESMLNEHGPVLRVQLLGPDDSKANDAAVILIRLGPPGVQAVLEELEGQDRTIQNRVLPAFETIIQAEEGSVKFLVAGVKSKRFTHELRNEMALILGRSDVIVANISLKKMFKTGDWTVHGLATKGVAKMHFQQIGLIATSLRDEDWYLRMRAAASLGDIIPKRTEFTKDVALMVQKLESGDLSEQSDIITDLVYNGFWSIAQIFILTRRDPNPHVRYEAKVAFGRILKAAKALVPSE